MNDPRYLVVVRGAELGLLAAGVAALAAGDGVPAGAAALQVDHHLALVAALLPPVGHLPGHRDM